MKKAQHSGSARLKPVNTRPDVGYFTCYNKLGSQGYNILQIQAVTQFRDTEFRLKAES
jgi:hypothetical protein